MQRELVFGGKLNMQTGDLKAVGRPTVLMARMKRRKGEVLPEDSAGELVWGLWRQVKLVEAEEMAEALKWFVVKLKKFQQANGNAVSVLSEAGRRIESAEATIEVKVKEIREVLEREVFGRN